MNLNYPELNYEGIITTRNWDGAIGAGLLSQIFEGVDVEFKNQVRSTRRKILLRPSLVGYVNLSSCVIIREKGSMPSFFLWGNMLLDSSGYPTVSSFIAETFNMNVPSDILKSLRELSQGYQEKHTLSKAMFFSFLITLEELSLQRIFKLTKERQWSKIRDYFASWSEKIEKTENSSDQDEIKKMNVMNNKGEIIYYPLGKEKMKHKALLIALRRQTEKKPVFLFGEKGGVTPGGIILSGKELDVTPFSNLTKEEQWEHLGKYNIFNFSFTSAKDKSQVRDLLSRSSFT